MSGLIDYREKLRELFEEKHKPSPKEVITEGLAFYDWLQMTEQEYRNSKNISEKELINDKSVYEFVLKNKKGRF